MKLNRTYARLQALRSTRRANERSQIGAAIEEARTFGNGRLANEIRQCQTDIETAADPAKRHQLKQRLGILNAEADRRMGA